MIEWDIPHVRTSTAKYTKRDALSQPFHRQWSYNMCPQQLMYGRKSALPAFDPHPQKKSLVLDPPLNGIKTCPKQTDALYVGKSQQNNRLNNSECSGV